MGKLDIAKGQILHKKGDSVKDIAIVLKGSFTLSDGTGVNLPAGNGTILGAFHPSGATYHYNFHATPLSCFHRLHYRGCYFFVAL